MSYRDLNNDIDHILVSEEQLSEAVTKLAAAIDAEEWNSERELLLVCILKGSVVFMGDLMKKIKTPMQIDFMKISSYGAGTTCGELKILLDLKNYDYQKYDILIVEDIIDSGNTLAKLVALLKERGADRVRTCTLLDKPSRRQVDFTADHVGIVVPDEFVVGYGLDFDEKYRELPYIGVLKSEVYNK